MPRSYTHKLNVLSVIYLLAALLLLYWYGIQTGGEAEKYIDNANRIIRGDGLRNGIYGVFYFVYSVIIAFFSICAVPLVFAGVLQVLLSLLAARLLNILVYRWTGNDRVALIVFVSYLLCYPLQKWNFYLYSESLHTSLLVFCLYAGDNWVRSRTTKRFSIFFLLMVLVCFSRPVGVIFLFAALLCMMIVLFRAGKRQGAALIFLLFAAGGIMAVFSPLVTFINPDSLKRMEVICQVPEANADAAYTEFNAAGPGEVLRVIREDIGIQKFFILGCRKVASFFGMYRDYYSVKSNLLLLINLLFYPFALVAVFFKVNQGASTAKTFSVIYLLLMSVVVFLTCDDWANRFISPVFPFIILLAGLGIDVLLRKFSGMKTESA